MYDIYVNELVHDTKRAQIVELFYQNQRYIYKDRQMIIEFLWP